MSYTFRKLDPKLKKDIEAFLNFQNRLNGHLKSIAQPLTEEQIKWQKMRFETNDEATYFCELDGVVVGFINVCNYHVVNNKRPDDDIGLISDIMIDPKHSKGGENAYILLMLGVDELLNNGKNRAMMVVQEDNEIRFLHFALADKIISKRPCGRTDGSKTISYELLISDLHKTRKLTQRDISKRALIIKRRIERQLIKVDDTIGLV